MNNPLAELSQGEARVVEEVMRRKMHKEIAYVLGVSEGSVKKSIWRAYRKIGVHNRVGMALRLMGVE